MLTDVEGIKVGHFTDLEGLTGCTVILPPDGTVASCEWRGGAPGDREWVLLQPEQRVDRIHGLVLSGGSAFGLAAADGVMLWLESQGIGWQVAGSVKVPIVPAAILFDLGIGDPRARPGAEEGRLACEVASSGPHGIGNVGAGTGCTAGKAYGREFALKSGIGTATARDGELVVSAMVAANPWGEVLHEDGSIMGGERLPKGATLQFPQPGQNTLIGAVATNAIIDKQQAYQMAKAGQDGVSTVVWPAHTRYDGDVIFGLGTRRVAAPIDLVLARASKVVAQAVRHAVSSATSAGGVPGLADIHSLRE